MNSPCVAFERAVPGSQSLASHCRGLGSLQRAYVGFGVDRVALLWNFLKCSSVVRQCWYHFTEDPHSFMYLLVIGQWIRYWPQFHRDIVSLHHNNNNNSLCDESPVFPLIHDFLFSKNLLILNALLADDPCFGLVSHKESFCFRYLK